MTPQYVYKVSGHSLTGAPTDKSWQRKKRSFEFLVFGKNLKDVMEKTEGQEFGHAITEKAYHNDVDIFPITEVYIEHATLITSVTVY